jgi:hypothetical protein
MKKRPCPHCGSNIHSRKTSLQCPLNANNLVSQASAEIGELSGMRHANGMPRLNIENTDTNGLVMKLQ